MATGKRAFDRGSAIETLSAILRDEPRPARRERRAFPAPFCWIVERCLSEGARGPICLDAGPRLGPEGALGARLSLVRGRRFAAVGLAAPAAGHLCGRRAAAALAILAAVVLGALAATRWRAAPAAARLRAAHVSPRLGLVRALRARRADRHLRRRMGRAARSGSSARARTAPRRGRSTFRTPICSRSRDPASSRPPSAAGSSCPGGRRSGTLALAPLEGGAPRETENDVLFADWAPDGKDAGRGAPGRRQDGPRVSGRARRSTRPTASSRTRASRRDGDLVAFLDHPTRIDDRGTVAVVDRSGAQAHAHAGVGDGRRAWRGIRGRNEIWFGAAAGREAHADLRGDARRQDASASSRARRATSRCRTSPRTAAPSSRARAGGSESWPGRAASRPSATSRGSTSRS